MSEFVEGISGPNFPLCTHPLAVIALADCTTSHDIYPFTHTKTKQTMKWAEVFTLLLLLDAASSFQLKKHVRSFGRLCMSDRRDESSTSVALDWAKEQEGPTEGNSNKKRKKFVVIGGGWGGWGAAKALCQSGIDADVTLIDALPDPTGVSMIQQACDD